MNRKEVGNMGQIHIKPDEHVFIPGMTGSGKSVLAEVYLAGFQNVVKLDTKGEVYERRKKGEEVWRGLVEGKDFTVVEHLADLSEVKTPKIIYAPHFTEQTLEHYDALLKWVYDRENTTIWVDELMEVCPSAMKYPPYIKAIMTRGRSKNVSMWALAQRTIDIPTIVLANTTHFFVFNLNQPQDRKKLADSTGVMEFYYQPGKYKFWYFKLGQTHAVRGQLKL
jgi:DNA helicase HerA-like ATPase